MFFSQIHPRRRREAGAEGEGMNELADPLRTLSRRTFLPLEVERIFRNLGVPTIRA